LPATYVVAFKTHAWDAFVARQFLRYQAAIGHGDLVIIADETNGPIGPIPHDKVIRTNNAQILALGLADAFGKGGLIWWNTDYPQYLYYLSNPHYKYYMFVEYDSCAQIDIDGFISSVEADGYDFVTLPTRQPKHSWYWTKFHTAVYPVDYIQGSLNCISVYSNRAMHQLFKRRLEMTRAYQAGDLKFWPGNEVFVATEMALAAYRCASLEEFGDASRYEWHSPILEDDLAQHADAAFLHPVLDADRFIISTLKFEFDLSSYFFANSPLRRTLARFPVQRYLRHLPGAFRRQMMVKLRQSLGAI